MSSMIRSDQISVDMSKAPWMKIATDELAKNIKENNSSSELVSKLRSDQYLALVSSKISDSIANIGLGLSSINQNGQVDKFKIFDKKIADPTPALIGKIDASDRARQNPEIVKYFEGLNSDPAYDKKGKSYELAPTYSSGDQGYVTAWCAAFVNWCLSQAGAPKLGYGTAASWLKFGTPLASPVYGCLTIIKPSSSTGSTTGHIAFYVRTVGANHILLGGNQKDGLNETAFKANSVLGLRWPTNFNHYLAADGPVIV